MCSRCHQLLRFEQHYERNGYACVTCERFYPWEDKKYVECVSRKKASKKASPYVADMNVRF
jgi:hypothetical protein